jgi:hypothetical protein
MSAGAMLEIAEVTSTEVRHGVMLEVTPDVFDGVELGSVGRQILQGDAAVESVEVLLNQPRAMRLQAIPHDQQLLADGPLQGLEELEIQRDRVCGYLEAGKKEGAKAVTGGKARERSGYFVEPTVFVNTQVRRPAKAHARHTCCRNYGFQQWANPPNSPKSEAGKPPYSGDLRNARGRVSDRRHRAREKGTVSQTNVVTNRRPGLIRPAPTCADPRGRMFYSAIRYAFK